MAYYLSQSSASLRAALAQDISPGGIGALLNPQTPAEIAAGVAPVNLAYPPGNVKRYNAKGDGITDDTVAIQAAINQCGQAGGNAVFFPMSTGDYKITSAINITAGLYMYGEADRITLKGPRISQLTNGTNSFTVTGTGAFSVTCENLSFAAGSATSPGGVALWNINPSSAGPNSFYWKNCWFMTPVFYAINASGVDDIQLLGCTFDITPQKWLAFGTGTAGKCTNVSVIGCTFADNTNIGMCDLGYVDKFIFSGNRCYANASNATYGINALTPAVTAVTSLDITGNTFSGYNQCVALGSLATQAIIANNTMTGILGAAAIAIGGGGTVTGLTINGNTIKGSAGASLGLIDATGTIVTNSVISNNNITANSGGTSGYCINLPQAGTTSNKINGNVMTGFTTADLNVPLYLNNGVMANGTFTVTLTGCTTAPTGTARWTVKENSVTLFLPTISAISNATTCTLTGLPAALQTGVLQQFSIAVQDNGANLAGAAQITNTGTISLFTGVGAAFTNSGTKGLVGTSITYELA